MRNTPKPERNKPCPCSSGLKFKLCCGSAKKLSEQRQVEHAAFILKLEERAKKQEAEARQSREFRTRPGINTAAVFAMMSSLAFRR